MKHTPCPHMLRVYVGDLAHSHVLIAWEETLSGESPAAKDRMCSVVAKCARNTFYSKREHILLREMRGVAKGAPRCHAA